MKIIEPKGKILKSDFAVSGIYAIVNKVNWKVYVGQACVTKKYNGIGERFYDHTRKLRKNKHFNPHLQNAWNKYGIDNFIYIILEENLSDDQLVIREQFWMDVFNSHKKKFGYNISPSAKSLRGIKYGQDVREKLRKVRMLSPPRNGRYKGVCFYKGKWIASFRKKGLGEFDNEIEAATNYDYHVIKSYGRDCYLNFPDYNYSLFVPKRQDLTKYIPTSKFVGVSKYRGKWRAFSYLDFKNKHLGTFDSEKEAAKRYDFYLIENNRKPVNFPRYNYSLYKVPNLSREAVKPINQYKGVTYYKRNSQWGARITKRRKYYFIGLFSTAESAAKHYDYYALKFHGDKSYLNFPNFDYSNFKPLTNVARRSHRNKLELLE